MSELHTRKKLDFLYQEVLGEVAGITQRIESASDQLADSSQALGQNITTLLQTEAQLQKLPKDAQNAVEQAIIQSSKIMQETLSDSLHSGLAKTTLELDQLSKNAARYATIALQSARKMALAAVVIGAASGACAALIVLSLLK